jgi:hypothetical protein
MFLRQKKFTNKDGSVRTYAQIVHSKKVDGVTKHTVLMDLGRIDEAEGKHRLESATKAMVKACESIDFLDVAKDLKSHDAKEYGPELIFRQLWKNLGLQKIIGDETRDEGVRFDVSDAVFNMVLNRLSAPSSKRQLECWQLDVYGIAPFDLHQYYRAMDYLIDHKDAVEKRLFYQIRDLFNLSVDVVLFDTTTIVYYGEGGEDSEDEILAHGFSKDKRGDLKQIVVGVMMSKEGVPLGHEVFAGNKNDVTCFKEIVAKIADKFAIGRVILVGDRGMVNQKNVKLLEDLGYEYILGFRMRTIPAEERAGVLSKSDLKIIKKDSLHWKEVSYQGKRLIVCYNPERALLDAEHREGILERIKEKLKYGTDVKTVVSNQDFKRFLKIEGKKPELDQERIAQDSIYDGVYVITSNTKLSPSEVIAGYRDLWQVEMAFRQLKTEIQMGPMYHWREKRIRAHIMICFFALVLRSELYRRLREMYKDVSYPTALNDLKALKVISLQIKGEDLHLRTELRPGAMKCIHALKMRSPARVLLNNVQKQTLI